MDLLSNCVVSQTFIVCFILTIRCDVNVSQAFTASRRVSKDDWIEWLRRLRIELLKESPSPAFRSCWALAQTYNPLAR